MPKFRVTTTEHRVYRVVYEVEAHDAAGAQAAIESDEGGTGDDDIGEVLKEHLDLQEITQITVGPVEEITKEELALRASLGRA